MNDLKLTVKEAYQLMFKYLEHHYLLMNKESDDLGFLLGSMALAEDNISNDPAMWADWIKIVKDNMK